MKFNKKIDVIDYNDKEITEDTKVVMKIINALSERMSQASEFLTHEEMMSTKCAKWFYNATLSFFLIVAKDVIGYTDEHIMTTVKLSLENIETLRKQKRNENEKNDIKN